jgi:dihydrodipicolinate synthase/N-acetylneuraminate lyase
LCQVRNKIKTFLILLLEMKLWSINPKQLKLRVKYKDDKTMKQLGVLVPVVTPCTKSGQPDLNGVKAVCKYFLDEGCHGIFVLGSTGRGPWFSRTDRAKICQSAKSQIGENIPLFAGCMATGLAEMLENAQIMADSGASIAVLTGPCYFNYNTQELEYIFTKFADNSPLPLTIYDIPVFTNSKLDTSMLSRLARHENIIGFKDSSADLERFKELLSAFNYDIDDFYLIQGKEHLLLESILNGASGLTVSLLHIDPKPFIALYNAAVKGDVKLANHFQEQITQIMEFVNSSIKRRPEISTLFHVLNYALGKHGICDNILLEHEGDCPGWLAEQARKAMDVYKPVDLGLIRKKER